MGSKLLSVSFVIFTMVLAGCGESAAATQKRYAKAIEAVLAQDNAIEKQLQQRLAQGRDLGETLQWAVRSAEGIDLRECPEDFRVAYARHLNACSAVAAQYNAHARTMFGQILEGALNSLGGELDGGARRIRQEDQTIRREYENSCHEVTVLAAKYNARLP